MAWTSSYSQIGKGKYQVCLDYCYFPCHGRYIFNFMENDSCEVIWVDDVSYETSKGFYHIMDSMIIFEPKIRPDSIQISLLFDWAGKGTNQSYLEFQQNDDENVLWLLDQSEKRLKNISLTLYRGDSCITPIKTDSLGYAKYFGDIADSITFMIQGRNFTVIPDKNNKPSWIKVYMDFHYLDLFDRIKKLKLINGIYWFEYICDNNKIRRTPLTKIK